MLTLYRSALAALMMALVLTAAAFSNVYDDEVPEVTARVARISFVKGDVKVRRSGEDEWETADLNLPLVEGDELTTGADGRVELQFGPKSHLRADKDSYIQIKQLSDEGIAVSVSAGSVTARLRTFEADKDFFEFDAPGTTVSVQKEGAYRLDAGKPGSSELRVTVTNGGEARVYSRDSGFQLRSGRSAKVFIEGDYEGEFETADAGRFADEFDSWTSERDETVAKLVDTAKYGTYYDQDFYGAEELNDNGSWDYTSDYGYIWQPNVSAISAYQDWSPYRYGSWRWVPPFGWTWVNDEPWGWATYHHGRWIWYRNRWVWTPYGYYRGNRSWWRPALVVIQVIDRNVCWYPLGYRNRYYSYNRRDHDRLGNRDRRRDGDDRRPRVGQQGRPGRLDPADRTPGGGTLPTGQRRRNQIDTTVPATGVITVPADSFGVRRRFSKSAPLDIARTALKTNLDKEPDAPELPDPRTLRSRPNRDFATQPPPVVTNAPGPTRTGAGQRQRGVALDGELRRSRVFGNRPPVQPVPTTPDIQVQPSEQQTPRRTGAVGRPVSPKRDTGSAPIYRPRTDLPTVSTPPADTQPRIAPPRRESPKPREANPEPDQAPRLDPPRRRQEAPRDVPPAGSDRPAPRQDPPPQRTAPPPREDPPPQRTAPQPRPNPPAPRQDPPRSAPPKNDAPRVEAPRRAPLGGRKQAPID